MDIWEKMYEEAQKLYNPHEVSDFVYANHVVAAVEAAKMATFLVSILMMCIGYSGKG